EARSAQERYLEAREELEGLGIASLNPNQGMAWIPFSYDNQLAWFVFDLFDSDPIRFWRYQTDPLETRREVSEIAADTRMASWTVEGIRDAVQRLLRLGQSPSHRISLLPIGSVDIQQNIVDKSGGSEFDCQSDKHLSFQ